MIEKYKIIKEIYSVSNFRYFILESENKLFFKKQLKEYDLDAIELLKNEVLMIEKLKNIENIPKIITYDFDKDYMIITKYITGISLNQKKYLNIDLCINIMIQLCNILDKIHSEDVIHCDIKGSNIMLTEENEVYLIDFSSSKNIGDIVKYGSINYCSLEQLNKKEANVDFDIYSLGIVFYEILTGKRAFQASSQEEAKKLRLKSKALLVQDTILNVSKDIDIIISKMIGKEYSTVLQIKQDLLNIRTRQ